MPSLSGIVAYAQEHLNFYRLHLLALCVVLHLCLPLSLLTPRTVH
jgi:hypothetical protein